MDTSLFRALPSIDRCLEAVQSLPAPVVSMHAFLQTAPRPLLKEALTCYWQEIRQRIKAGVLQTSAEVTLEARFAEMLLFVARFVAPKLRPLLNGTGVVIHTNTGRSLLAKQAQEALQKASASYTTLEFNGETGGRGSRNLLVKEILCRLTGAEDALVVNNNAAAVLLTLDTFCKGHEAILSRGELVEIGGSFRIPDVMEATGVRLREVGATNRTHEKDYLNAIGPETKAIVRVHSSNFRIIGFHSAVSTQTLAKIAHEHTLLLINDLGSGSLVDFQAAGLPYEPTVQESLTAGSDLVLFSGDKLLGGPQAGLIVGKAELIAQMRSNPLLRALRLDKLAYAALEATLRLYLEPHKAQTEIPTLRMILASAQSLHSQAKTLQRRLRKKLGSSCEISLRSDSSRTGGGAFPEYALPTTLVALTPKNFSHHELKTRLLQTNPIVIGRLEEQAFCLDPRTLLQEEYPKLEQALCEAFGL